ncbi:hypothetical protein VF21_09627 [Pseudogymnoascus sp. 05NY08]|nr:hypothetical protein VF21_09627 [Pseudogymnoascus sp. 05NY08]
MTGIAKLTGPNYCVWSLRVKRLLQSRGLWDVVDPLPKAEKAEKAGEQPQGPRGDVPPAAPPPAADFGVRDAQASCLIMELCDPISLNLIVSIECAQVQWARLRRFYGPSLGQYQGLREEFGEFAAKAGGKGWAEIVGELERLQRQIGEVPGEVKPGEEEMLGVLNEVARGEGGEYGKLAGYLRVKGEYTYQNFLASLVSLEWQEARSEGKKSKGGWKRGGGGQ